MPQIFDNINQKLLPTLEKTLGIAYRADFCVGYFNLRGWRQIDSRIEEWTGGTNACCRLLVGMQRPPKDELRSVFAFQKEPELIDQKTVVRLKRELAQEFRQQLTIGAPTNADEAGLRRLAQQIKSGKLQVKLFLRHPLHAKLYLLFREDMHTPIIGYMGSSNLTFSGLSGQGELNIDVLEQDAANKLALWFNERWEDKWCVDISEELIAIIEESWASEKLLPPYYIYLKMAYHLAREARAGLSEFTIPPEFRRQLFDFQTAAVKIAARHLNQRGGVLIGDVVGLGKTLMATAVAKILADDYTWDTLILCPKNLVPMWEYYRDTYQLPARVLSISRVQKELPSLRRYRVVLIDESHNLRNREGKRYKAIKDYIERNECRCILLSATPYNKSYQDLSSQLRLFVPETTNLGVRPEQLLREIGEIEFNRRHQVPMRSLAAFEKSEHPDDWRELISLFMVRRTRSFIRDNYAKTDPANGRKYLLLANEQRVYFPTRQPKRLTFDLDENDPQDPYARLYTTDVVETINDLHLPRYGLGNYAHKSPKPKPTDTEQAILNDLSRGGRRLMGFSRTNLFKRLESSGHAFLLSVERHLLRNAIFIYALENNLNLPIGTQGSEMLDPRFEDDDAEAVTYTPLALYDESDADGNTVETFDDEQTTPDLPSLFSLRSEAAFRDRAATVYNLYAHVYPKRFKWIRPHLFDKRLLKHLQEDADSLLAILQTFGEWLPTQDKKLAALHQLLTVQHPQEKVLVFSQFADTVHYLAQQLPAQGVAATAAVTGQSSDPTHLVWRFSPVSNGQRDTITPAQELRVLIATDVLSEGQNLQDAAIVVNYDLPWAIIRLIQRAGRVDRLGQQAADIFSYTFWPAEGVERLIHLRERLRQRLRENAEVVGSDEAFFEDDTDNQPLINLYHEKAGILDEELDSDIDLTSYAYQIWKNAIDANPKLEKEIEQLPTVVYATKALATGDQGPIGPSGVLVYLKTDLGNNALAWVDENGRSVTESQFAILRAAQCTLNTPALSRQPAHHDLVETAVNYLLAERVGESGGQLGRPSGARFQTYDRLKKHLAILRSSLWANHPTTEALAKAVEQIYYFPLREASREKINRQLRSKVNDIQLAELVTTLYEEEELCLVQATPEIQEPHIICSMGVVRKDEG